MVSKLTPAEQLIFFSISIILLAIFAILRISNLETSVAVYSTVLQCLIGIFSISSLATISSPHAHVSSLKILLSVGFVCLFCMDLGFGIDVNIMRNQPTDSSFSAFYLSMFCLFMVLWTVAWGIYGFHLRIARKVKPILVIALGSILLILLKVSIDHYHVLYEPQSRSIQNAIRPAIVPLEWTGLVVVVLAISMHASRPMAIIGMGYTLLVSTDYVFCVFEISKTITSTMFWEFFWCMAEFIMLYGCLDLHVTLKRGGPVDALIPVSRSSWGAEDSVLLVSMGSVLLLICLVVAIYIPGSSSIAKSVALVDLPHAYMLFIYINLIVIWSIISTIVGRHLKKGSEYKMDTSYFSTSNARARDLLIRKLPSDDDFDAFCIDHFHDCYKKFSAEMTRTRKTNILIETIGGDRIHAVLSGSSNEIK